MNRLFPILLLANGLPLAAQAVPENVIGISRAVMTSRLLRPDAMPAPGGTANLDLLNRLDPTDYQHYHDDGFGNYVVSQMQLAIHDENDLTTEDWSVVWYTEDVGNPGHPDPFGPALRLGPIPMPPPWNPQNPSITWFIGIGFGPPATLPNNQRIFYGFGLPPAPNQNFPNDGLSALCITDSPQDGVHDVPGRAMQNVPFGTYSLWHLTQNGLPSAPAAYLPGQPGQRQLLYCDMGGHGAGGTPIAVTNQTSFAVSNPGWGANGGGGTTSAFSGLHPDVFGWNVGRADDPGFLVYDQQMVGCPAFLFAGLAPFGPLPVTWLPGLASSSFGMLCLDTSAAVMLLDTVDASGFAQGVLSLSNQSRQVVRNSGGIDLIWQALVVDLSGPQPRVHATGCARQHL
jgi:hypothetical protein